MAKAKTIALSKIIGIIDKKILSLEKDIKTHKSHPELDAFTGVMINSQIMTGINVLKDISNKLKIMK